MTDRRLSRDGVPVELNGRYLDALILLVAEQGRLVPKSRLLDEVWRGVPVTDEALTQCVRVLRNRLGDDAARPRFIATVPKHGYRFVADVRTEEDAGYGEAQPPAWTTAVLARDWTAVADAALAGAGGGLLAGVVGGLIYALLGVAQPGMGQASALLVLVAMTAVVGLVGGAGTALGAAIAGGTDRRSGPWSVAGGAVGGLAVGGFVRLLGTDALTLVVGRAPTEITGAFEGLFIGAAVGLGLWAAGAGRAEPALRRGAALAGLAGMAAGAAVNLLGGRTMAGSLDQLALTFPDSRLSLDQIGALFGEQGLGPISRAVTGALEGFLFVACVVGAMILAARIHRRRFPSPNAPISAARAPNP